MDRKRTTVFFLRNRKDGEAHKLLNVRGSGQLGAAEATSAFRPEEEWE